MGEGKSKEEGAYDETVVPASPTDPARDPTVFTNPPAVSARVSGQRSTAEAAAGFPVVAPSMYAIERELARGGMGRVLIAHDKRLARDVALKELLHQREDLAERFEREALITARLQHPSIVPIYEAGQWPSGERFYAMKLVAGKPLDQVVAATRTVRERVALVPAVIAVGDALAFAHKHRVIHRDLKPQNILVGEFGETIVVDWGIAKDLAAPEDEADGIVVGTPAYMPPEQAAGKRVDERADVYSLGAVLYHVLAKRPPFEGRSTSGVLSDVEHAIPDPLLLIEPTVPPELGAIVGKAMARNPTQRYANASELVEDLRRFQTGQLVRVHDYSLGELVGRWARKYRGVLAVATIALAVLVAGGVYSVRKILAANRAERASRELVVVRQHQLEREMANSKQQNRELMIESARREWIDGHLERAASFLAQAYADPPSRELQLLTGLVERGLTGEGFTLPLAAQAEWTTTFVADSPQVIIDDGTPRVFDLDTGALVDRAPFHDHRTLVATSRDGHHVLTTSAGGDVQMWHDDTPISLHVAPPGADARVVMSDRGERYVAFDAGILRVESPTEHLAIPIPTTTCTPPAAGAWRPSNLMCDRLCARVTLGGQGCGFLVDTETTPPKVRKLPDDGNFAVTLDARGERVFAMALHDDGFERFSGSFDAPEQESHSDPAPWSFVDVQPGHLLLGLGADSLRVVGLDGADADLGSQELVAGASMSANGQRVLLTTNAGFTELWSTYPTVELDHSLGDVPVVIAPDGTAALVGRNVMRLRPDESLPEFSSSAEYLVLAPPAVVSVVRGYTSESHAELLGAPDPQAGRLLDLTADGTRALECETATCEHAVVVERATRRRLGTFEHAHELWFATPDWLATVAPDDSTVLLPLAGGAPRPLPVCNALHKAELWLAPDATVAACLCAHGATPTCGLGVFDLAHGNRSLAQVPCDRDAKPFLLAAGPDAFSVHGCGGNESIVGRDGTQHCTGGYARRSTDGKSCVNAVYGEIEVRDFTTHALRVRFGTHIAKLDERDGIVYSLDRDGVVALWDRDSGALLATHQTRSLSDRGFGVSADGTQVFVATPEEHRERWIVPFETRPAATVVPLLKQGAIPKP